MTVAELIDRLREFPPDMEVMILDGFNGGGFPREINSGPGVRQITVEHKNQCFDCESLAEGQEVVTMGYGCY